MTRRRIIAVATGLLVAVAATGTAHASHNDNAPTAGGPHDYVSGHVKRSGNLVGPPNGNTVDASVSAHRLPDGGAHGRVEIRNNFGTSYGGEVVCLRVVDNDATVGFRIEHDTRAPSNIGQYMFVRITDQGNAGGREGDAPDFFSPGPVTPVPPAQCMALPTNYGPQTAGLSGNFVVHDGELP